MGEDAWETGSDGRYRDCCASDSVEGWGKEGGDFKGIGSVVQDVSIDFGGKMGQLRNEEVKERCVMELGREDWAAEEGEVKERMLPV